MNGLPEGWEWSTLGDLTDVTAGPAFKSKEFVESEDGVRLLRGDNIEPGSLRWRGAKAWPVEKLSGLEHLYVREDDVILAMDRPVVSAGLKLARVTPVDVPALLVQRVARIRSNSSILPGYLYALLQQGRFVRHLLGGQTGTQIPHVNLTSIRNYSVPVPPIPEQRRIVDAIEEHFSRLDASEASLSRAANLGKSLEEASFTALLDEDWPIVAIGEIGKVGSGSTPSRSESRYWHDGTVPWVSSAAVNEHSITAPSALITEAALAETSVKLWPPGTVLVAMYGEGKTRGNAAILKLESTCNQACAAIVPGESVVAEYLRMVLTSQYEQNRKLASGGVQPNLNLGLIREMRIPLPSVATQHQVVESAASSTESLERMTEAIANALRRSESLRRSILAAAFSGQLVPQVASDEPASALLERMSVERAASKPTRKKKAAS